ncbi:MAG: hypothetical protein HZB61_07645 [Nitrospirae bacterium]|nr:hypothetical protein [Nitrospirota bacterium]
MTVNLFLFSSWYVFLFRNKVRLSFSDRLLGVFVLGLAQIVLTEMTLGLLKKLYAAPLFVLNVCVSVAVLTIAVIQTKPGLFCPVPPLQNVGVQGLAADIYKEMKDKKIRFVTLIKSDWILLAVFIVFSIYFCYLVFAGYLFPSYSWDALLYHLPTVGFILQSGAIEQIPYNSLIYTFINVFPKNMDLYFLWNIIFLKTDIIVDLSQLPFTVAGMLAIYSIGRKLGIEAKYSAYSCFLFFFAPVIILQSTTNYVDIAVSVFFLIAVNFILCRNISHISHGEFKSSQAVLYGGNIQLFMAGTTAGMLLGSKGSGPLFIIALSALYLINELRIYYSLRREEISDEINPLKSKPHGTMNTHSINHFKVVNIKKIIKSYALYFAAPVTLLGSYWYISNWVHYGNPVYPFIVKIFGKTLFAGTFTEFLHTGPDILRKMPPMQRPLYVWLERVEHYYYASDLSGFGPLWFILLLPSTVFAVILSVWKKKFDFFIVAVMMVLVFLVYPNNWFTRYVIFLFGLGCLAFGVVVQYFKDKGRTFEYLALCLVLYTFFTSNSTTVTPGKIKEFIHLPAKERSLARLGPDVLNLSQYENYGLWSWISVNISESDTLAYTFTPELLSPLWNNSFSNKIIFVKSEKFKEWLDKLEINNATCIVVLLKPRSMEYLWLERLGEMRDDPKWSSVSKKFRLEYHDNNFAVFRFNK